MVRILILHGLGMNMRGKVKQEIYGHETLAQYDARIAESAKNLGLAVDIFQSNIEGELVNKLYEGNERGVAGAVLNPAGFSIGYRGLTVAITQVRYPVVEARVSNPLLRGIVSDVGKVCQATVAGFGIESYLLAMDGLRSLDCGRCQLKARCCPNTPARKIPRSLYEGARDLARSLSGTPAFEQSRRERKKVEMLFAHLKRILWLDRLRLRGPCGARTEFLLAATAQNLRKLAKLIPIPAN